MTATSVTPAATPAAVVVAPAPRSPVRRLRDGAQEQISSTPGMLGLLAVGTVLFALFAGLLGAFAIQQRSSALDDARSAADQLVLLQTIRNDLVAADADATTAFLVGGLEPADVRSDYIARLAAASAALTTASRSAEVGSEEFGAVNEALTRYTGLIEAARANNRQGNQIGAAYLRQASTVMSEQILPALTSLTRTGTEDVNDSYSSSGNARWWLALAVVVGIGGLVFAQVWLARRTHRYVNLPLLLGSGALLLSLVAGVVVMSTGQSEANAVRAGPLLASVDLAQARTAAFDAKSTESLALINRGSGAASEPAWTASMDAARAALDDAPDRLGAPSKELLEAYAAKHAEVRALDDAGNWDAAVQLSTGSGAEESADAAFTAFADASAEVLTAQAATASDRLDGSGSFLLPLALLVLVLGAVAAVTSWWGVSQRREEYR